MPGQHLACPSIQGPAEFQPIHQLRVHLPHLEEAVDHPSLEQVRSGDKLTLAHVVGEGVDQTLRLQPGQAGQPPPSCTPAPCSALPPSLSALPGCGPCGGYQDQQEDIDLEVAVYTPSLACLP
jgi:hypothetical protein